MRSSTSRWAAASFLALVAGCGSVHAEHDGGSGPPVDARLLADATEIADAGRADAAPPPKGQEIVTGSGHLSGATFQLDVQIGHAYEQRPASGPTQTLQGNAVVKP
jgi:hypothetical protein